MKHRPLARHLASGFWYMRKNQTTTNRQKETQPSNQAELDVSKTLPFEDFKESLGQAADKYSDEQIETMRIVCDKMASLAFDTWLNRRNAA